jgi:hypothetical protein
MNKTREKEAINAYLKLLQAKGANSSLLHKRSVFLDHFSAKLHNLVLDGNEYRLVVEDVMETTPAADWHDCLTASREFYPFWVKDIKAIASLNLNSIFEVQAADWKPDSISLKTLTDSLDTEKFDTSENWPLKAYAQALRDEGADSALVDTRVKLAKIILMRIRSAPSKNNMVYRTGVDLTLPLFNMRQNRRLFLVVVREFFHFWSGNPDAASMVLQDNSGNMLL